MLWGRTGRVPARPRPQSPTRGERPPLDVQGQSKLHLEGSGAQDSMLVDLSSSVATLEKV